MEIWLRAKEIARQKGFNQSSLSRAANVDFKTIKRIFQDPTRDVSLSTVVKIAWALNVSLDEVMEIHGEPHRRPDATKDGKD
ncbi:XRE family transcriptional regulator [Ktedonosporobacter rubrisoli]|uniref:XRE family transcriptional regulator n=1 Tax=Ktedonosporobacter rubrisoli TaxID=2509675 RepID=A0A4P6JWC5_KTERU|nr:helix-turn-helix transcriptional regulator [Ktedonosporobacter rubrisoli]QBD79306.1 XRE family transcriptional regulator [Ktedonosporobacter rubrisoli]